MESEKDPGEPTKSRFADWETENPAAAAARGIPIFLAELKAYAAYFLSAKIDGYKAAAKKIAALVILGIFGLLIGAAVLFAAAFLLLGGIAHGLGALFGGRMWLGELIVGFVVLAALGLTTILLLRKFTEASRKQTERKYEGKRIQQRVEFGRDVHERSAH